MRRRSLFFGGALILLLIGFGAASWAVPIWEETGPISSRDAKIYCFAANETAEIFFVGTSHGIFRHPDTCGTSEQDYMMEANNGLPVNWYSDGHYHCNITALAVSPPNGKIFAGAKEGGIYRSDDGGLSWTGLTGFTGYGVTSMVIDHEGRIYVGTDEEGVWSSSNNGADWVLLNEGLENYAPYVIDLAIQDNDDVVAMLWDPLSCPVFHLANGSQTWEAKIIDDACGMSGSLEIDAAGAIYARDYNGRLYRSGDDGAIWTKVDLPGGTPVWAMTTCEGGHLFAGYSDTVANNCKYFITSDNGASWETRDGTGNLTTLYHSPEGTLFAGTNSGIWMTGTGDIHFRCCATAGDVNSDNSCNVGDAVSLVNYIFKGGQIPCCQGNADANGDDNMNVGDAVYIINYIFKDGPPPAQ